MNGGYDSAAYFQTKTRKVMKQVDKKTFYESFQNLPNVVQTMTTESKHVTACRAEWTHRTGHGAGDHYGWHVIMPDGEIINIGDGVEAEKQAKLIVEKFVECDKLKIQLKNSSHEIDSVRLERRKTELERDELRAERDRLKEENEELKEWKRTEIKVVSPIFDWGHAQKDLTVGTSIVNEILKRLEEHKKLTEACKKAIEILQDHYTETNGFEYAAIAILKSVLQK